MTERAVQGKALRGKRVAFTGKLASMTRAEAADLVRSQGGEFVRAVARHTSLLVVGLEGWPLQKDGRLTRKLLQARRLQHYGYPLNILPEEELLSLIGLEDRTERIHRLFTTAQLGRILRVPGERLRAWMDAGLIHPAKTANGIGHFDFQQVTRAKTLCDLAQAGVSLKRLRRNLERLRKWLPNLGDPLAQLAVMEQNGDMLVRLEDGQLAEPTGQLHFDFAEAPPSIAKRASVEDRTGDEWFELARECERSGRLQEAADAYRQSLLLDRPHPDVCYNLANVLYALDQKPAAVERYHQALELDSHFAPTWNNLGNVLADLGRSEEAIQAFRKALEIEPQMASARHNLRLMEEESRRA
jgi:tetratricopeptide (TPR) repeat protein